MRDAADRLLRDPRRPAFIVHEVVRLAGQFESGNAELAPFQFMSLAALRFQRLRSRDAGRLPAPFPAGAPLDEVETLGQGIPVVVAFAVAGNGKQLPIAVDFDLLDDVDVRHGFHLVGLSMGSHRSEIQKSSSLVGWYSGRRWKENIDPTSWPDDERPPRWTPNALSYWEIKDCAGSWHSTTELLP